MLQRFSRIRTDVGPLCITDTAVILNQSNFIPHHWEDDATGISWIGAGDAAKHPTMHRTALPTTKNYSAQYMNSAEAKNSADAATIDPGFPGIKLFSNISITAYVSKRGLDVNAAAS